MSKTNKILLAILAVLILILCAIGGVIGTKMGLFESRNLAEPFNETRYSGTIDDAEGLTDDIVPVVLVIRFHEGGKTGELTSPTLQRHSTLARTEKNTYREEIVHGDGESGIEWTFTPGEDDTMGVSYTTPDGASGEAQLPKTDPTDTAGEVGMNPNVGGTDPDGIEFPEQSFRTTGTLETAGTPEGEPTDVIFRWGADLEAATVTYPDRGCYGLLDRTEPNYMTETITVGDCPTGATWHFIAGDPSGGSVEYTSPDGSQTETMNFTHSDWDIIDGEIGLSRSGPVLDFYRKFTEQTEQADNEVQEETQAKGSCDPSAFAEAANVQSSQIQIVVMYCDGTWATAGEYGTSNAGHFHFADDQWSVIPSEGQTAETRFQCFDHTKLREQGAPDDFLTNVIPCS